MPLVYLKAFTVYAIIFISIGKVINSKKKLQTRDHNHSWQLLGRLLLKCNKLQITSHPVKNKLGNYFNNFIKVMSLITFDYFLGTFLTNVLNGEIKVLKHKLMSIVLKFVSTPLLIHVVQNVPKVDIPAQWKDSKQQNECSIVHERFLPKRLYWNVIPYVVFTPGANKRISANELHLKSM